MELISEDSFATLWVIRNQLVNSNTFFVQLHTFPDLMIIIDPGSDSFRIFESGIVSKDTEYIILLTHGHFDHVAGVQYFLSQKNTVFVSEKDAQHLKRNNFYLKALKHNYEIPEFSWLNFENFNEKIYGISIYSCPGHTRGSVMFHLNNWLFTGDSVLSNSISAPTVKGNDLQKQFEGVKGVLSTIGLSTYIHPGHGKSMVLRDMILVNSELRQLINGGEVMDGDSNSFNG